MTGIYDRSIYAFIEEVLVDAFVKKDSSKYEDINPLLKGILTNNGCAFTDNAKSYEERYEDSNINIIFVSGAMGNYSNDYYDFIYLNGTNSFVIFTDYFTFVTKENSTPLIGNSNYYAAICDIIDKIVSLDCPSLGWMATTTFGISHTKNRNLIAAYIISCYKEIEPGEIDLAQSALDEINEAIENNSFQLYYAGIRKRL